MERFWSFGKSAFGNYDFRQLVNTRIFEPFRDGTIQIVCDIDKTYLETSFETKMQMLRIVLEEAKDKVTVQGASPFLVACRWRHPYGLPGQDEQLAPRPLHFVSASPPQLRNTLEEKLRYDGLDWTSDTFKNQAYNIRKGRIGLLRHHVAYKTATLYTIMKDAKPGSRFLLIGDNAEFDGYIYIGLALFLDGKLSADQYIRYLVAGGIQDEVATDLRKLLLSERPDVRVDGILIREAPGYQTVYHPPITDVIFTFGNYFEALMLMIHRDMVDIRSLPRLVRRFHNQCLFPRELLISNLESLKQYGRISEDDIGIVEKVIASLGQVPLAEVLPTRNYFRDFCLDQLNLEGDRMVTEAEAWASKLAKDSKDITK
ncbi:phosphatase domain-containing protein [Pseudobacteriovorax antillogorgiicola]|uniref:Uncharacterized conserved protein n=1 Tax=Pseudobacteriovorax antillogorgiicola TaxID=1513793 RepID=A0A1Y6BQ25_9BACT|nr:phosphatase domain-containing protein [Pseudobacteriovorax antillogorgiicola]TCS53770.1 uncharacterized protein DUF2183 [Pseudobacteriovorax antillogorgiicola]SMF22466.1 Uncharacterized conserved protein [Pseudobacteriovorax antillogorgiicola]